LSLETVAAQRTGIGLIRTVQPTDPLPEVTQRSKSLGLSACICGKNVIFVTTTPIDIKPSTCPAHGQYTSACKISPSYDAAFRRR